MSSYFHSTLWELKASFSENVKAQSSCILFSLGSDGGGVLLSVKEISDSFSLSSRKKEEKEEGALAVRWRCLG